LLETYRMHTNVISVHVFSPLSRQSCAGTVIPYVLDPNRTMEVLRRLRLPDAKSVIPKFGSNASHHQMSRKERALLPQPEAALADVAVKDGDKEAAASIVDDGTGAESPQTKKTRGKQPIAPKPDENASVIPTVGGPRRRPPKPSTTRNASPNSTRSRRIKGRNQKPSGQPKVGRGGGGGAAQAAQDPPGNVQRNQSIVASHHSPRESSSSASLSFPGVTPVSKITKPIDSNCKFTKGNGKSSKATAEGWQGAIEDTPGATNHGEGECYPSSHSSQPSTRPLGTRPMVGRGPLGMERRPTPAPYVMQSPSGVDAKKSAAVVMSSLLDAGGGVIGELEGAADCDEAVNADSEEQRMMNQETPRTRNVATFVAAAALSGGAELPLYAGHNSSASLEASQSAMSHSLDANNASGRMDDEEASLPDAPQSLGASLPNHPNNPNDSTTSLGRQSTTSAAVRRRGRSQSRTRQRSSDPVPATVSVGDGGTGSACPGSPSRTVTRSRSQRRQRRSRSRSKSRARSGSADVTTASPKREPGSSPGANDGDDAARLSPSGAGRRPQRAPPVTKRTHAQKMSMKNAIKAADLDILAPVTSRVAASLAAASSDSMSVASATARSNVPVLASSPALAVSNLAETARWKAPEHGGASGRQTHLISALATPAATAQPSGGDDDDGAAATPGDSAVAVAPAVSASPAAGESPAPKRSTKNPVRALTHGLLKRRPSFGGASVAGVLLRGTSTNKVASMASSPPSAGAAVTGPEAA
jgi:hypothetical protein